VIAQSVKHWACNRETLCSDAGHGGSCCEYELLTFILGLTALTSLRLRRSGE